ncbi:4-hydroxythreonine-4-phosphate dehydrogenase PdxA [Betaproteobacteria bacterium SCN2]|jgi:4-hydroxythreonine-4-phosphate dehydrogenase|nr:4-hydroxythreonine-4-phosphate dehydrogenase PdxA [Betaproteobacteria bacterium SCN2]
MSNIPVIAYTCGEPAGIGPDLAIALAGMELPCRLRVLGNMEVLSARARQLGQTVQFVELRQADATPAHQPGRLAVQSFPLASPVSAGTLDVRNSAHVLALLDVALQGCMDGSLDAMVTGPVHKGIINDAGMPFTGHTEYLAEKSGTEKVVMMLTGGGLRVALATTHLPLKEVAAAITRESLAQVLAILHRDLVEKFGIARPRIAVCGLNPHAGESGHLGREEIEVIEPVLDALRKRGMDLSGPLPADTLFAQLRKQPADAVLAMYHDQGLPVLKYASFGEGINVTLGLPFIRTSVDHGTALELAGSGQAETGSLLAATKLAIELATSRTKP